MMQQLTLKEKSTDGKIVNFQVCPKCGHRMPPQLVTAGGAATAWIVGYVI